MKRIGDLKHKILKIEYGPASDPKRNCIDVIVEIPKRLEGDYVLDDLQVSVVDYIPPQPYSETDRSRMPPHYLCGGSLGFSFYNPAYDSKASLYLVDFLHSRLHHNPWLWGWNFNKDPIYDKAIPDHDRISLAEDIVVELTLDDMKVKRTFKGELKKA